LSDGKRLFTVNNNSSATISFAVKDLHMFACKVKFVFSVVGDSNDTNYYEALIYGYISDANTVYNQTKQTLHSYGNFVTYIDVGTATVNNKVVAIPINNNNTSKKIWGNMYVEVLESNPSNLTISI
jgi:hypothetical protein